MPTYTIRNKEFGTERDVFCTYSELQDILKNEISFTLSSETSSINNNKNVAIETFKENIKPVPVTNPDLVILNKALASELDLDFSKIDKNELSKIFSGECLK